MSMSLLKKSMAIVEEDLADNRKLKEKEGSQKKKGIHKQNRSSNDALFQTRVAKKTISDIRKELASSSKRADENLEKLLTLTKHTVKIRNPEKLIERALKGRYVVEEEKPAVEEESVFTEEDFAAFEKELAQTI